MQAIYEQITVRGSQVLRVKLTPMAEQVGLPALLPENVRVDWVMARTPVLSAWESDATGTRRRSRRRVGTSAG